MVLSPQQVKERQERRSQMTSEDRRLEALETIADSVFDIKVELMSIGRILAASSRTSSFGR